MTSPSFLCVLPAVWGNTTERCLRSMFPQELAYEPTDGLSWSPDPRFPSSFGFSPAEVLLVDNTRDNEFCDLGRMDLPDGLRVHRDPDGHNLGVAGSWNVAAREVLDQGLDWLVIVSASMLFGRDLHTTFRSEVEAHPGAQMVESMGNSWHLIAIARSTLEAVGLFDPNFYPAYEEAIDWGYRQRLVGLEDLGWPRAWCNAMSIGYAVHVDPERWNAPSGNGPALAAYYESKWGGPKGAETFTTPWGDPDTPLDYWPDYTIPELAHRYDLEVWW